METDWLSPDGEFITVAYMEHIVMAEEICARYYHLDDIDYEEDFLFDKGWVRISYSIWLDQTIAIWRYHLTNAQKQYFKSIINKELNNFDATTQWHLLDELDELE